MDQTQRLKAVQVRNLISSYYPGTRYEVKGENLHITVKGGLLPEQRQLAIENKALLMELFTTPPEVDPMCYHGHSSKWVLNENGVWVCPHIMCQPSHENMVNPPAASKSANLVKYWLERAS